MVWVDFARTANCHGRHACSNADVGPAWTVGRLGGYGCCEEGDGGRGYEASPRTAPHAADGHRRNKGKGKGNTQKVKDEKADEEVAMAEQSYQWVDEETIESSSTAKEDKAKEDKAGWSGAWCRADAAAPDEEMMERPKKVSQGDGRGAGIAAASAATLVENGRGGSEPFDPNVFSYAKPNPCMLPSGMGQAVEEDWYRSSMDRVDGEDDYLTFKRAFWGKFSSVEGNRSVPQFWMYVASGSAWKGPGDYVQCWNCKESSKNYKLYLSHREWECLYLAYDMHQKRIVARCELCEYITRCEGYLPWYAKKAGFEPDE